jgi:hypothetical protein
MAQACSSEEKPVDLGLKYFPLKVGNVWTYNVSEVTYDTLIQDITTQYQEKHEIIEIYKNQQDDDVYVIHVSKREDSDDGWEAFQTWTAKITTTNEIIVSEENIPYLKMILPVSEGVNWRGNKYNTIESERSNGKVDDFLYLDVTAPYGDFTNTITVQESNDLNLSYKDVRYTIYADGIGVVYEVDSYIAYCDDIDCFGLSMRKHEHTKIQTLVDHVVQ